MTRHFERVAVMIRSTILLGGRQVGSTASVHVRIVPCGDEDRSVASTRPQRALPKSMLGVTVDQLLFNRHYNCSVLVCFGNYSSCKNLDVSVWEPFFEKLFRNRPICVIFTLSFYCFSLFERNDFQSNRFNKYYGMFRMV